MLDRTTGFGSRSVRRPRPRPALFGAALGTLLLLVGSVTVARAGDDEQTWEGKVIDNVLGGIGIRTGPGIDYRERSPLVVPPKLDLPPPEDAAAAEKRNPAWPVDADIKRRRQVEARAVSKYSTPEAELDASGRPIPRSELDRGGQPAPGSSSGENSTGALDASGRPLSQDALGTKSIFSSDFGRMFGFGKDKEEYATFTHEPTRETLIDPPPGYRTPSPNEPYGISPKRSETKPASVTDHGTELR